MGCRKPCPFAEACSGGILPIESPREAAFCRSTTLRWMQLHELGFDGPPSRHNSELQTPHLVAVPFHGLARPVRQRPFSLTARCQSRAWSIEHFCIASQSPAKGEDLVTAQGSHPRSFHPDRGRSIRANSSCLRCFSASIDSMDS